MTRTSRLGRGALACLLAACAGSARAARHAHSGGDADRALRQLTAAGGAMYAIRGADVVVFDERGAVVARCSRFPGAPSSGRRAPAGTPDAAETLRAGGLPDDDSTLAAEELLDDEAPTRPRRPVASEGGVVPRALAADGDGVWIATSDGLYRGTTGGCRRVALAGLDLVAVAAGPNMVVAASTGWLFRSNPATGRGPWSAGFQPLLALTTPPRALAIDRRGDILIAGDSGLLRADPAGELTLLIDQPADALAACGGPVLALSDDGVVGWDGQRATRVAARPPIKVLACGDSPRRWLGAGVGVWSSPDGATWTEHPEALGLDVTGVASAGGALWVAGEDGLAPLQPSLPPAGAGTALAPPWPRERRPVDPPSWRLPIVTASLLVEQTPLRRATTGMVLLTFPLGRSTSPAAAAGEVAAALMRRDAALTRTEVTLARVSAGALDAERAARLAAVRDEIEAAP